MRGMQWIRGERVMCDWTKVEIKENAITSTESGELPVSLSQKARYDGFGMFLIELARDLRRALA